MSEVIEKGQDLVVGGTVTVEPRDGQVFQVKVPGRVDRAKLERAIAAEGGVVLDWRRRGRLYRQGIEALLSGPGDAEARAGALAALNRFTELGQALRRIEPVAAAMGKRAREIGPEALGEAIKASQKEVAGLDWEERRLALLKRAAAGELGAYQLTALELDLELAEASRDYEERETALAGGYQPLRQALSDDRLWQDLFAVEAPRRFLVAWQGLDRRSRPLPELAFGPDGLARAAQLELLSDSDLQAIGLRLNGLIYLREATAKN